MVSWLSIFFGCIIGIMYSDGAPAYPYRCRDTRTYTIEDFQFHKEYKVTTIFSDFVANTTSLVREARDNSSVAIWRTSQGSTQRWLTYSGTTITFNETSCTSDSSRAWVLSEEFKEIGYNDGQNIGDLVSLLHGLSWIGPDIAVAANVQGLRATYCKTNDTTNTTIQVDVVFAAEKEPMIPPEFKNPRILAADFLFFNNTHVNGSENIVKHLAFEFSALESLKKEDLGLFSTPSGLACENLSSIQLPIKLPDQAFEAVLSYSNSDNVTDIITVVYDQSSHLFAVRGRPQNGRFPFLLAVNSAIDDKVVYNVVHDFGYGFESVTTGVGFCVALGNLSTASRDSNSTSGLADPTDILFNYTNRAFYRLPNSFVDTTALSTYRSHNGILTVEILLNGSAPYQLSIFNGSYHETFSFSRVENIESAWSLNFVNFASHCFKHNDSATFTVTGNVDLNAIYKLGISEVEGSVARTLSEKVNINPARIRVHLDETTQGLTTFISLSEKSNFNSTKKDVALADAIGLLNSTLKEDIDIKIGGKTALHLNRDSLGRFPPAVPPPSPPAYTGYSGGSMFVLAVFCLLFGAGIGVGAMFLIVRRQRISTLAYQVFE